MSLVQRQRSTRILGLGMVLMVAAVKVASAQGAALQQPAGEFRIVRRPYPLPPVPYLRLPLSQVARQLAPRLGTPGAELLASRAFRDLLRSPNLYVVVKGGANLERALPVARLRAKDRVRAVGIGPAAESGEVIDLALRTSDLRTGAVLEVGFDLASPAVARYMARSASNEADAAPIAERRALAAKLPSSGVTDAIIWYRDTTQLSDGAITEAQQRSTDGIVRLPVEIPDRVTVRPKAPRYRPDQKLIDGAGTGVGQAELEIHADKLNPEPDRWRVFLHSDNILSSQREDRSSRMGLKLGATTGEAGSAEGRFDLNGEVLTNQAWTDSTYVVTIGHTLKQAKEGQQFRIGSVYFPSRPNLRAGLEYRNRFEIDRRVFPENPKREVLGLSAKAGLEEIRLFGGKVRPFENRKWQLNLDAAAEGWYFPSITTLSGRGTSNLKGLIEVALGVVLGTKKNKTAEAMAAQLRDSLGVSLRDITVKLRVGYRIGAQEATGFVPDTQVFFDFKIKGIDL